MALSGQLTVDTLDGSGSADNEMISLLREIRDALQKDSKLQQTGLSGSGGALTAALMRLLGGTATGVAGAFVGAELLNATLGRPPGFEPTKGYANAMNQDGSRSILEIDATTGKISRILTEQQARDEGILDNKNRIKAELQTQNSSYLSMTENLAKSRDAIILTAENLERIQAQTAKEVKLRDSLLSELELRSNSKMNRTRLSDTKTAGTTYRYDMASSQVGIEDEELGISYSGLSYRGRRNSVMTPIQNERLYSSVRDNESLAISSTDVYRQIRNNTPVVDPTSYSSVVR